MRLASVLTSTTALFAIACSGGGSSDSPDAGPPRDAGNPDPIFETSRGTIRVAEGVYVSEEEGPRPFGRLSGAIATAAPVSFHTETMREGNCRLLTFQVAQCDPYCDGICVDTDECVPWPTYVSAGRIDFEGLASSVALVPEPPINYYNPTSYPIPEDLFDACDAITATAAGGDVPAFEVTAFGVDDLSPDVTGVNITLDDEDDFTLTWEPSGCESRVRLTLNAPNEAHGLPYTAIIECDGPDTGSLTVPRSLIEAFPPTSGQAICVLIDCPLSTFTRYTRGTASIGADEVELVVASELQFGVIHAANRIRD